MGKQAQHRIRVFRRISRGIVVRPMARTRFPHLHCSWLLLLLLLLTSSSCWCSRIPGTVVGSEVRRTSIVVVGSINADTFLPVARIPLEGENLTTDAEPVTDVPGGKGCTQAVAVAKLLLLTSSQQQSENNVYFVGQLGNDAVAKTLEQSSRNRVWG